MRKFIAIVATLAFVIAPVFAADIEDVSGRDQDRMIYEMRDNWHALATGGTLTNGLTVSGAVTLNGGLTVKGTVSYTATTNTFTGKSTFNGTTVLAGGTNIFNIGGTTGQLAIVAINGTNVVYFK